MDGSVTWMVVLHVWQCYMYGSVTWMVVLHGWQCYMDGSVTYIPSNQGILNLPMGAKDYKFKKGVVMATGPGIFEAHWHDVHMCVHTF